MHNNTSALQLERVFILCTHSRMHRYGNDVMMRHDHLIRFCLCNYLTVTPTRYLKWCLTVRGHAKYLTAVSILPATDQHACILVCGRKIQCREKMNKYTERTCKFRRGPFFVTQHNPLLHHAARSRKCSRTNHPPQKQLKHKRFLAAEADVMRDFHTKFLSQFVFTCLYLDASWGQIIFFARV